MGYGLLRFPSLKILVSTSPYFPFLVVVWPFSFLFFFSSHSSSLV